MNLFSFFPPRFYFSTISHFTNLFLKWHPRDKTLRVPQKHSRLRSQGQAWQHMPVLPVLRSRVRPEDEFQVSQGLQQEFKISLGYTNDPVFKKTQLPSHWATAYGWSTSTAHRLRKETCGVSRQCLFTVFLGLCSWEGAFLTSAIRVGMPLTWGTWTDQRNG